VFAKTNHCCETPAICRQHYQRKMSHVKSSMPQSQSIVSCDPPCRNSTEILSEGSVLVDVNVRSVGEYVDRSQSIAAFRCAEVTGSAISDVCRL
jgi:hypothetical protein